MSVVTQNTATPEEIRKRANEILKGVDQLIKAGKLDPAMQEIARAKEIDPQNGYIRAFEERVAFLKEEEKRKKGVDASRLQMEEAARKRLDDERKRVEEERRKKEIEMTRKMQEVKAQRPEPPKVAAPAAAVPAASKAVQTPLVQSKTAEERKKIEDEAKRKFEEEFKKTEENNRRKSPEPKEESVLAGVPSKDGHAMYKRVLLLAWADGALTPEERKQLQEMRTALSISESDHLKLDQEAKEESYAHAFELAWTSGLSIHERSSVIAELRSKFQLIPDIYSRIESKLLARLDPAQQQPMIYVVDDEDEFLKLIARVLENAGFQVKAFNTSDDAFNGLQNEMPNLILSDINLETSSAGGFTFYERVRQLDHLIFVPFIFLSGMADEGMVRYGKGLGADDYLTKPFSSEMLLDTVKGKLKRFKPMRKR